MFSLGHIYEKSKCTAHFALIFRLKFDALGVDTHNLILTSCQMSKMWVWRVSSWTIRPIVFSGKFSRIFCSVRVKFQNSENTRTVAVPCTGEISDSSKPPAQYPYPVRAKSRNLKKRPYNPQDMYGRNLEISKNTRIIPKTCTGEILKI